MSHVCHVCSEPLALAEGQVTTCERCGHKDRRAQWRSNRLCLVFTLTALILYVPANVFPFMTIELYGNRNSSTVWSGVMSLLNQRSYTVAIVVFLASIVIPTIKLLILFYLALAGGTGAHPRFKMKLYQFVEAIGRWSMLDIFLLAILVAMVKLGHWAHVQAERGAVMFALTVIFTMLASRYFDPRILWQGDASHDSEK